MLVAACPNCGAEIRFQSAVMPVRVCEFCHSTIMRSGEDLKYIGEVASLPADVSPLQLGTRGMDGDIEFAVVGRTRWQWSGGGWNEWMLIGIDGREAWLGEAMGKFMLLRELPPKTVARRLKPKPEFGQSVGLAEIDYRITDVKTARCVGAEGELPYLPQTRGGLLNIDLAAPGGLCASIQTLGDKTSYYAGRFATLESLKPSFLRTVPGWDPPVFAHG